MDTFDEGWYQGNIDEQSESKSCFNLNVSTFGLRDCVSNAVTAERVLTDRQEIRRFIQSLIFTYTVRRDNFQLLLVVNSSNGRRIRDTGSDSK